MNTELLKQKAELLEEYFGIHIDAQGNLGRLPLILDQYTPDMDRVPEFVLCLGNDVSLILYFRNPFFSFPVSSSFVLCKFIYVFFSLGHVCLQGLLSRDYNRWIIIHGLLILWIQ